ncbi:hypothetical protein CORC01_04190 [Colletotrichum orchidophilum]|uniref:Uncharacterized protein n=1 Tax=Colletotrichum orchidophilum TaxID=1209926 RepID=A0A1G4BG20_9PEZI|nr:uncharacterized protein CORC01_04190 [Colletotrichum orchidophilum]OHF00440.1 hypothetical protein CORC01_04190 [Colletotrichum orchidophilum]
MDPSETSDQHAELCGLLILPLELREQIYGHLIHQGGFHSKFHVEITTSSGSLRCNREPNVLLDLAFLRVNKQIYAEAIATFYATCIFKPVADEQTIQQFFGRLSEYARAHVLYLELTPRRSAGRRILGPQPNISQIHLAPAWGPACSAIANLLPGLIEVSIRLRPVNTFELRTGCGMEWICVPLSSLQCARKTLHQKTGDVESSDVLINRWDALMEKAVRETKEYTAGMEQARRHQGGWTNVYWRKKRIMAKLDI